MRVILTGFWLIMSLSALAWAEETPRPCGDYFGQEQPGLQPTLFAPGIVSTDLGMYGTVVFTSDMSEAYWVADESPDMWWSQREKDCWTAPEVLTLMPGYRINSPVLAADDKRLYFLAAERDSDGMDRNDKIWYVDRIAKGWSDPVCLPAEVNAISKHFQFSVAANGDVYFGGEGPDLYIAELEGDAYAAARPIEGPINSKAPEVDPCISLSGDILIFTRFSRTDVRLMASFRSGKGDWGEPVSLHDALGGATLDSGARFSPDGKYLFFQSQREGGAPNRSVYWVETRILDPLRKKP